METLTYFFAAFIIVGFPAWYILSNTGRSSDSDMEPAKSSQTKLEEFSTDELEDDEQTDDELLEPFSLRPQIDENRCIGVGTCVLACPEDGVLGISEGLAKVISPTKCLGHGACLTACPMDAISLVMGSEQRSVELPYVKETFETNKEGLYIVGELGGMGLIRNAMMQGQQVIDYVYKGLNLLYRGRDILDVIIVGAGPAGISASLQAMKRNLSFVTLEQETLDGAVLHYPRQKVTITEPLEIPLFGKIEDHEISKEDLCLLWRDVIKKTGLRIRTGERVEWVEQMTNGHFLVRSSRNEYVTQRVVLAIGRAGSPQKLNVPGEDSSKVTYRLIEPEQYARKKTLVIGGGDSAVEAALSLAGQRGTQVVLSYWKKAFGRLTDSNQELIDRAMKKRHVNVLFESNVTEIQSEKVYLNYRGKRVSLANDYVFVLAGGFMTMPFLRHMRVSMEREYRQSTW